MLFGEKLREMRTAKGFSQKSLAEAMGTFQQNVARWETGEATPGFDAVLLLCRALGVRVRAGGFEECTFGEVAEKRGRGRPPKAEPALEPKRKRKGGAA